MHSAALLRLLQLADSAFPTGAFAFSHGLEGLANAGFVRDEEDVAALLRAQVEENLAGIELPAMLHAHRFATAGDLDALLDLDGLLTALKRVPAFRAGSAKVGRRFLESAAELVDGPALTAYRRAVGEGRAAGHHAVAFGVVVHAAGVDREAAALAFGAGFVGGLAAAAVRLGLIGQAAAQRTVARLHPAVLNAIERAHQTPPDEMGAYLPMVDVAGLRQPSSPGRLFAS